jgi:hypothetical protein
MVQFIGANAEEVLPPESELARLSLESWPPFRLRIRTWPLTLNFTQPDRFNPERLIHREPGAVEHHSASRVPSFLPIARDYALLAAWMLGGTGEIPDRVRPLIYDHLSNRSEAALGGRREFLERFSARATGRPGSSASPVPTKRKGAQPGHATNLIPADADSPLTLGQDSVPFDSESPGEPAPGFAETLFGTAKPLTAPVSFPLFSGAAEVGEYDEEAFLDGPPPGFMESAAIGQETELDPAPAPNRLLLWLFVVVVAALLAGVAAHLNGTAFWLK